MRTRNRKVLSVVTAAMLAASATGALAQGSGGSGSGSAIGSSGGATSGGMSGGAHPSATPSTGTTATPGTRSPSTTLTQPCSPLASAIQLTIRLPVRTKRAIRPPLGVEFEPIHFEASSAGYGPPARLCST